MKRIVLEQKVHTVKIGDHCENLQPTIDEDALFLDPLNGEIVGFYIRKTPEKLSQLIDIANAEFLSNRVPKIDNARQKNVLTEDGEKGRMRIKQFSTIMGAAPARPIYRRDFASIAVIHSVESAKNFIKAMLLSCHESEEIIRQIAPKIFDFQTECISQNCPPRFKLGRMFTSSISNFNIAANFHRDGGNLPGCVNVILAKKKDAIGGNLTVPDYGLTVNSCDGSMLVYPAWRNMHGVTPIIPNAPGGYRNSFVFYPLKGFTKYV